MADLSIILKAIDDASPVLRKAAGETGKAAESMKRHMRTAGFAMAGASAAVGGASLKMAADFDGAMREVNTMMGLSEEQFQSLSDDTQELARRIGVDATESAEALYQAISAGVPEENAMTFLETASKAAIGGVTDTETAVDGLSTVINAFGMDVDEAQHVSDVMFQAIKGGKTNFEELSASMSQAAPMASAVGVSFEEVMAATATLTSQGTPTAQAMTQMRQAMVSLTKPTADMETLLAEMGYESGRALIEAEGFSGALQHVRDAAQGNDQVLGKALGSVESLNALYALTGENAEMAASDIEAMENAAGAAENAFREMEESPERQWERMVVQFKDVAITIGKALLPVLTQLLDSVTPVIQAFANFAKEHPVLVTAAIAIAGAIGALLVVIGPLVSAISGLIAAAPVLGAALAALTGPVGIVIAIITGIVIAVVAVIKHWDAIKAKATEVWSAVSGFVSEHAETIKDVLLAMTPVGPIIQHWEEISGAATWIFDQLVSFFGELPARIGQAFEAVKDFILAPFRAAIEGYKTAIDWLISQVNKLSIDIPSWVPGIGGKTMGFDLPKIELPSFATGGIVRNPTLAMIGERGPEAVVPLSGQNSGAGNINNIFNIAELVVREDADVPRIARELHRLQESRGRARGLGFAV